MKLSPQAIKILDILEGKETLPNGWHCPKEWGYADGHCKRITDINEYLKPEGLEVDGIPCICSGHDSKQIKMRKIIPLKEKSLISESLPPQKVFITHTKFCCGNMMSGKSEHSGDCKTLKEVEEIKQLSFL